MRMRSNFVLAALMSLPVVTSATVPTITSATGTVQTGQTLTVSGANMNNEAKTNWDAFFVTHPDASSFEGSSPVADGYSVVGPPGGLYDTTVSILGSKSMKFHVQGPSTDLYNQLGDYQAIDPVGGDASDKWIRAYVRWSLNGGLWPSSHIKMIDSQGGGGLLQYYFQPVAGGGTLPTNMIAVHNATNYGVNFPSGQMENNRWYAMELHWKTTSPNLFEVWIDGTKVYSGVPTGGSALNYLLFGVINACCTDSSFNLDNWFDGLAVATSRIYPSAVVEIGNKSDYATATKRYQAPLFISDGSVQIKADLTGLGAGPYYLWVTNNRQERSQAYVLGQGGNNTLAAPQDLNVQ